MKGKTIAAILLGIAGASTTAVAVFKPEWLKFEAEAASESSGTNNNGTNTTTTGSEFFGGDPPFIITDGGGQGSVENPGADSSVIPPEGGGPPVDGTVVIEDHAAPPVNNTPRAPDPSLPKDTPPIVTTTKQGRVVKLSPRTGLAVTAGTPIAEGTVERVRQKVGDRELSLIVTAAFEPLGKDTTATSVRGTPLAQRAVAKEIPTLAGLLETKAGGLRQIRGSPELFKRIEANLLSTVSKAGNGAAVITPPKDVVGGSTQVTKNEVSCGPGTVSQNVNGVQTCVLVASKNVQTRGQQRFGRR